MSPSRGISVVYVTHRIVPRFDWFAASLARQIGDDDVEVIVVDGAASPARAAAFAAVARGRFALRHVPAKPTPFNGPHRRTRTEYFAAASARNTGIVHARKPYVVFADDASLLMPGWWRQVRAAAAAGRVVAGAYRKSRDMVVEDGVLVASRQTLAGIDSRWEYGSDRGPVPLGGGQLFGCSFGAPRDLLVTVNGFDELCDSIGGEDWQLGVRLEWTAGPIWYDRRMLTVESEELHRTGPAYRRIDRTLGPRAYRRRLRDFGVTSRHADGPCDSSHMILDILHGLGSNQTMGNYYLLSTLGETDLSSLPARFPRRYWFDDQPLSTL